MSLTVCHPRVVNDSGLRKAKHTGFFETIFFYLSLLLLGLVDVLFLCRPLSGLETCSAPIIYIYFSFAARNQKKRDFYYTEVLSYDMILVASRRPQHILIRHPANNSLHQCRDQTFCHSKNIYWFALRYAVVQNRSHSYI